MKKFLILSILLASFSTFAEHNADSKGNRIECSDVIEGENIGGKFEAKMDFDAFIPSLVFISTRTLTGMPPVTSKMTYLSPKSVCGLDLDFAKNCKFRERITKLGYDFTFTCGNEITSAEIYCDEDCFTTRSSATFRCVGPKVDKKLSGGGLVFSGCKFHKANP